MNTDHRDPLHGIECIPGGEHRQRHGRRSAYATVVLSGAFVQTGYSGRYLVEAGEVVRQPTLARLGNRMVSAGVAILRLPWRFDPGLGGAWRGCDVDAIRRMADIDLHAAAAALQDTIAAATKLRPIVEHRADRFFADLLQAPDICIGHWSSAHALSREALARRVRRLYGATPSELRGELRARIAWRHCMETAAPLAAIALDAGYADQAHMTRGIRQLTGTTPAAWRHLAGHPHQGALAPDRGGA